MNADNSVDPFHNRLLLTSLELFVLKINGEKTSEMSIDKHQRIEAKGLTVVRNLGGKCA